MKTNPNDILTGATKTVWKNGHGCTEDNTPLTKREYFAAMAKAAIEPRTTMRDNIAKAAVKLTDELIKELNKQASEK